MLRFIVRYKISILLTVIILTVSLLPGNRIPDTPLLEIRFIDKVIHFGMYALFSLSALSEMRCRENCFRKHAVLLLLAGSVSLAIEITQGWVIADRSGDAFDLLANITGLAAGTMAYRIFPGIRIRF